MHQIPEIVQQRIALLEQQIAPLSAQIQAALFGVVEGRRQPHQAGWQVRFNQDGSFDFVEPVEEE